MVQREPIVSVIGPGEAVQFMESMAFDSTSGDSIWNEKADFDADGTVTVFDYIILNQNFGMVGDESH